MEPNSVENISVINVCENYISEGDTILAENLINRFLEHFPDDAAVQVYKRILSEPEPAKVSPQRRREIEEQVLMSIADPIRRATQLGMFYRMYCSVIRKML